MSFDKDKFKEAIEEMKDRILIVEVLMHYGIRLTKSRTNEEYAYASCPLPTHPKDDKGNNKFNWHIPTNRWNCYHPNCNIEKWGDCINLVMALDRIPFTDARKKLDTWFPNKNPAPQGTREAERGHSAAPLAHSQDLTRPAVAGKGFMHQTGVWLDEVLMVVPDEECRKVLKKQILEKVKESYTNGKAMASQ